MVIGSGPAGMEAALVARARGHDVSIWERDPALGGKLEAAALAPSKREVLRFRDYQVRRLGGLGVEIHTGIDVTAQTVAAESPDVVLIATGAEPLIPPIPGIGAAHSHDAVEVLRGGVEIRPGDRVAVIGGSATGCETAELVRARGAEVTILEMRGSIGFGIEAITRRTLLRQLRADGVTMVTNAKVVMIEDDRVLYEDADDQVRSVPADVVALALGWRPRGAGFAKGLPDGPEVIVLGDASAPADFVHAINAGADAGLTL